MKILAPITNWCHKSIGDMASRRCDLPETSTIELVLGKKQIKRGILKFEMFLFEM